MPIRNVILLCVIVALCAAAASVAGLLVYLRSDAGTAFVLNHVNAPAQWPDVSSAVGTTTPIVAPATTTINVLVPKAYATADYQTAISAVVSSYTDLASTSMALRPILLQINANSVTGHYDGLFDLIVSAKTLMAQQHADLSVFGQSVSSLNAANQSTQDSTTKSDTQTVIAKGQTLYSTMSQYALALDELLSGPVPSKAQLDQMNVLVPEVLSAASDFDTSMQALSARLSTPPAK